MSVTGDMCRHNRLDIIARNIGGDIVMGEGSTSIKKVGVRYSESIKLCVKMKDKRGKPKGRVELELQIDPKAVLTPSPVLSTDVSYHNRHLYLYFYLYLYF